MLHAETQNNATHEESEVEEAEDVFGARGAAVGHHGEDGEVEVAMRSGGLVAVRGSSASRGHRRTEREQMGGEI